MEETIAAPLSLASQFHDRGETQDPRLNDELQQQQYSTAVTHFCCRKVMSGVR
jgi:hypothetical protein